MATKPQLLSQLAKILQESKGFEKVLHGVKIISASDGNCLAEYKVDQDSVNKVGTLHGGYSATLVDIISGFALCTKNNGNINSISVNMNLTYLKAAKLGEEILIDAKTKRAGKTLSLLEVEIKNKATGDLLVKGSHTTYFVNST